MSCAPAGPPGWSIGRDRSAEIREATRSRPSSDPPRLITSPVSAVRGPLTSRMASSHCAASTSRQHRLHPRARGAGERTCVACCATSAALLSGTNRGVRLSVLLRRDPRQWVRVAWPSSGCSSAPTDPGTHRAACRGARRHTDVSSTPLLRAQLRPRLPWVVVSPYRPYSSTSRSATSLIVFTSGSPPSS